ncbi:retrovirus-related pol polyprotein from transposon TNT 1-94 [Tanacetum coccineum]
MSSECNHVKLAIRNDKSEVICAMCKQCLITANHDVCMLNYVNDMNSRGKKQIRQNVSNTENQRKNQRWSPTGRLFDIKGKIIASSESESQSDCSNGDNACTSNPSVPTSKRFPNSTSFLGRVYFVEGLGHNLFSVGQFCDSDLEVAFRKEHCFAESRRSDLLKDNRSTKPLHQPIFMKWPLHPQFASWLEQLLPSHGYGINNDREGYWDAWTRKSGDMNVTFDELSAMDFEQRNSKPGLQSMTSGQISSGLDLTYARSTITSQKPTEREFTSSSSDSNGIYNNSRHSTDTNKFISQATNFSNTSQDVDETRNYTILFSINLHNVTLFQMLCSDENTFVNPLLLHPQDHPLEQVIGEPSRPVLTRNQLRYDGDMCMYALTISIVEPKNVKGLMTDPAWIDHCKRRFFKKHTAHRKHRLVVVKRVFAKRKNDFEESLLLLLEWKALRIFLAYAALKCSLCFQMDVKMTFLHSTLKEDVYVCQPEGFIDADHSSHVYKLKKALYGLKQAPRAWYDELSTFLLHNHFFKGTIDPTLFIRRFDDDNLVVQVYVDDIIFGSTHPRLSQPEKHLKEAKSWFAGPQRTKTVMRCLLRKPEYVSLSVCCAKSFGCGTQLTDYGFHFNKIPIYCDSTSAIAISCNPVQHSRTKHIVVRYHFIKEHVEKGTIELYFVKTDYQLADLFTKAFQ